jgi:hypothetical protein
VISKSFFIIRENVIKKKYVPVFVFIHKLDAFHAEKVYADQKKILVSWHIKN